MSSYLPPPAFVESLVLSALTSLGGEADKQAIQEVTIGLAPSAAKAAELPSSTRKSLGNGVHVRWLVSWGLHILQGRKRVEHVSGDLWRLMPRERWRLIPDHLSDTRIDGNPDSVRSQPDDGTRVEDILSVRAANTLRRARLRTLEDVSCLHVSELEAIPNLGRKSLGEITAALVASGLETRPGVAPRSGTRRWDPADTRLASTPGREAPTRTAGPPGPPAFEPQSRRDIRLDEMVALRREGASLREIGKRLGLSPEWVRRMLGSAGHSTKSIAEERRAHRLNKAKAVGPELLAGYRAGENVTQLARQAGVNPTAAQEAIIESATAGDRAARRRALSDRRSRPSYGLDALRSAITDVARELGRTPSSTEYAEQASELGLPSLPTVANRFGSWTNAVRAAGLTPLTSPRRAYSRRWTEEACWRALHRLVDELGDVPTAEQYDLLATADDELPSIATVRNRLGRWSELGERLLAAPHPHPTLRRIGISEHSDSSSRNERVWLAHLEGDVSEAEIGELLQAKLFTWDASYGEPPDE